MDSYAGGADRRMGNALRSSPPGDGLKPANARMRDRIDDGRDHSAAEALGIGSTVLLDGQPNRTGTADRRLFERLAMQGFAGREYEAFHTRIVVYGQRVVMAWIGNGTMHRECAEQGRPVGSFPSEVDVQDRWDLATDTAVEGAALFRKLALLERKWSPAGGASLATFYIGSCVQVYPNIFRRWARSRDLLREVLITERLPEVSHDGPDRQVPEQLLVRQLRQELGAQDFAALTLHAEGFTYAEIAHRTGVTVKAVDRTLQRGKAKARLFLERMGGLGD